MDEMDRLNEDLYNRIEAVLNRLNGKEPRIDMLETIRNRFPSPSFFVEANPYTLTELGLSRLNALYFGLIPALARRCERETFGKKPLLKTLSMMTEFLKAIYIGINEERFHLVLLDSRGKLIDALLIGIGTEDSAPFFLKRMLSRTVQKGGKAAVICHNHPGGTLRPSDEDIACTLKTLSAFNVLGVPLLDHIIVAGRQTVSIRQSGLIPGDLWVLQAPKNKLLREWMDGS